VGLGRLDECVGGGGRGVWIINLSRSDRQSRHNKTKQGQIRTKSALVMQPTSTRRSTVSITSTTPRNAAPLSCGGFEGCGCCCC
jgi:hypothetical protein